MTERKYPGMWVDPEDDPRDIGKEPTGERDTLLDYLRMYRLTLEMKCEGLDAEQMARRSVPPSTLSLLGMVRHLAYVEHNWFKRNLQQRYELPKLYEHPDDPDFDFNGAKADPAVVEEAWTSWRREVADANAYLATVGSLDDTIAFRGGEVEVRNALVHIIEIYARHMGHVDLLRECIDGRKGA